MDEGSAAEVLYVPHFADLADGLRGRLRYIFAKQDTHDLADRLDRFSECSLHVFLLSSLAYIFSLGL